MTVCRNEAMRLKEAGLKIGRPAALSVRARSRTLFGIIKEESTLKILCARPTKSETEGRTLPALRLSKDEVGSLICSADRSPVGSQNLNQ
jgi:hypothetical protein